MVLSNLNVLAESIKTDFPKETKGLNDAFDSVINSINGIYDSMNKKIKILLDNQLFDDIEHHINNSKQIIEIKNQLVECIGSLEDEESLAEEIASVDDDEEKESNSIPNYKDYVLDRSVGYSLAEDFTHSKACGFTFWDEYNEVANMKWVLIEFCAILAMLDEDKMRSMINDESMKGRKISYFSDAPIVIDGVVKNEQILETGIYVWTSLNCNTIKNIIIMLLKKYDIDSNDFKIHLRADYKELHQKETSKNNVYKKTVKPTAQSEGTIKIGKYVQNAFKQLEDTNHVFSPSELKNMLSAEWTLKNLGCGRPLLREYDETKSESEQIKVGKHCRYWIQAYKLNNKTYFVSSQWNEGQKERFDIWFNSIDIKKAS